MLHGIITKLGQYVPLDTVYTWIWHEKVKGQQKVTRGHLVKFFKKIQFFDILHSTITKLSQRVPLNDF